VKVGESAPAVDARTPATLSSKKRCSVEASMSDDRDVLVVGDGNVVINSNKIYMIIIIYPIIIMYKYVYTGYRVYITYEPTMH